MPVQSKNIHMGIPILPGTLLAVEMPLGTEQTDSLPSRRFCWDVDMHSTQVIQRESEGVPERKKNQAGLGGADGWGWGCAVVNGVVSPGLAEKVTFEEAEGLGEHSRQREGKKHT